MHSTLLASVTMVSFLSAAGPLAAQTIGGSDTGSGSSIGGSSMSGSSMGAAPANASGWPPNPWPPSLGSAANDVGPGSPGSTGSSGSASGSSTQQRATEGSSSVSSVNADAVARSGDFGAATRIGADSSSSRTTGTNTFQSIAGTGPAELYNIPVPRVSVDLDGIRAAIRKGPNSTPDRRGF